MPVSVTVVSDTHLRHRELGLPPGDLLIHCGDMFNLRTTGAAVLRDIDAWFGQQPFAKILCIGGNHDHALQDALKANHQPFANAHYLQDEVYSFEGLTIYGSPWVPGLPGHAFHRGQAGLQDAWQSIPKCVDVLVTHTPPAGILDRSSRGQSHGCPILARRLPALKPRVHCFGHVHASAGETFRAGTKFINASMIESRTGRLLSPHSFEIAPNRRRK